MRPLTLVIVLLTLLPSAALPPQPQQTYEELRRQAETSYAEKSFARAHELYAQISALDVPVAEKRWVRFRLADTEWRSDAGNPGSDSSARDHAREALEALIRESKSDHDVVYAEANESLGDFYWLHPRQRNVGAALPFYTAALEWWSGSSDLATARKRYLAIVFRLTERTPGGYWAYGAENANSIPAEILVNAIAIAATAEDRAHAQYLLAVRKLNEYQPESVERALELLDAIIATGKSTSWYDDALFMAASRLAEAGAPVVGDDGVTKFELDYVKSLQLYRRLVNEFTAKESRYYEGAQRAIDAIVAPSVMATAPWTFLPESEQQILVAWRNVDAVELTLTPFELIEDVRPAANSIYGSWIDSVDITSRRAARRWTWQTNDKGDHVPGNDAVRVTPKLEPGAYVLEASANGNKSRQLYLVTDANVVVHGANHRSDVFVCDAVTGQPIADARVRVWNLVDGDRIGTIDAKTAANGFATLASQPKHSNSYQLVAVSAPGKRQAWVQSYTSNSYYDAGTEWRIYAFTDRPAYRPEDTVHWKIVARTRKDNDWITPANATLRYVIVNPMGAKIAEGTAALNQFGTFWADLPLSPSMTLGEYTIQFTSGTQETGSAQLFRLEEYKLPEFRVDVKTPEENGRRKQYRLGDTVEASIDVSYYFGGPVANANVQVVVRSRPLVHYWYPWREYDWYWTGQEPRYPGQEIKTETVKTDAQGHATVTIETQRDRGDTELTIEARVTDASRREVIGEGTVRVTKHRYSVVAHPDHFIHKPDEKVTVTFKAVDANDQPVAATGTVKVIRRMWHEDSQTKIAAYRDEDVLTTTVTTDAKGEGTMSFVPSRDGYYAIRWTSDDRDAKRPRVRDLVTAETAVWVSRSATVDIGYRSGDLEVIVDKESFRSGQPATIMIATRNSGRWVMLSTSANGILDTKIIHLDGTVKMVQFPITDKHVPVFFITASSVFDRMLAHASQRVVVPPVAHFLDVDVKAESNQYEPRQEATFVVTTRNVDGIPVAAEVAFGVSDEAVTAIGTDPAGDPRQFFFGDDRASAVNVAASVQAQRYALLTEKKGRLLDVREEEAERKDGLQDAVGSRRERMAAVGNVTGASYDAFEKNQQRAVAEAITVTAAAAAPQSAPPPPPPPAPVAVKMTGQADGGIDVHVRSDFRATAFWKPDVITDKDGIARIRVTMPESLTTWRATARAFTTSTQVGMGSGTAQTNMPLMVRLQAPRFFVAGDRATISAVINNNSDQPMSVQPSIEVEGVRLATGANAPPLTIAPHGEARADWEVLADNAGPAKLRVSGRSSTRGDAMEKTFVVYDHGIDALIARSGKLRGEEAIVKLDLPHDRRSTSLVVQVQPSLAVTMLDALPYLIEYPYGCTEQTMSRFLPAAIVARTLAKSGLDARAIETRMFGGIEKKTGPGKLGQLADVMDRSLARLYDFQHDDGGWGWWKESASDDFMTAYVVWGFSIAKSGGIAVKDDAIARAVTYLDRRLVQHESAWQDEAWILHAIAEWRVATKASTFTAEERKSFEDVYAHRDRLTAYSRALLAVAAHDFGQVDRTRVLVRNLEDGAKMDRTPDQSVLVRGSGSGAAETMATVHWGEDHFWWHWYDGPVETTSFVLQALVRIDPANKLIEPAMNWLVKNRRGAQWNNTRDTAIAILALNDYLDRSGELQSDVNYDLTVNGRSIASRHITAAEILGAPGRFVIDTGLIRDDNEIRIRSSAPVYFSVEGRFVSLEEPVKPNGNEIFVRRDYSRLAARPTLLKGTLYDRVALADNGSMNSGERVEVVVTIEAKNDYDYLMFEDLKPAGLEAIALQSGNLVVATDTKSHRSVSVYQELRDRKVVSFIDHLPQGIWEIKYTLRGEVPGSFHALPVLGQAMYVPEIKANSEELRIGVR